jgi:hypothetical protein
MEVKKQSKEFRTLDLEISVDPAEQLTALAQEGWVLDRVIEVTGADGQPVVRHYLERTVAPRRSDPGPTFAGGMRPPFVVR